MIPINNELLKQVVDVVQESMGKDDFGVGGMCDESNEIMIVIVARPNSNGIINMALGSSMLSQAMAHTIVEQYKIATYMMATEPKEKM